MGTIAKLVLDNGQVFVGHTYGATGSYVGAITTFTNPTGYQEFFTDPTNAGRIVVCAFPQVGNVGVNLADRESRRMWVAGAVINQPARIASNWQAEGNWESELADQQVIGISGVDTRQIIRAVSQHGVQRAGIFSNPSATDAELVDTVQGASPGWGTSMLGAASATGVAGTTTVAGEYDLPSSGGVPVAVLDLGLKASLGEALTAAGLQVTVHPAHVRSSDLAGHGYRAVVVSNGPIEMWPQAKELLQELLSHRVPVLGVGNSAALIAEIAGVSLDNRAVEGQFTIAAEPSGLGSPALDAPRQKLLSVFANVQVTPQIPLELTETPAGFGRLKVTHQFVHSGQVAGFTGLDAPIWGWLFNPEGRPGPLDARFVLTQFAQLVKGDK